MKIRPFDELDQEAVIQLWHDCNLIVAWNDPVKDISRKLLVDRDLFLVGEVDGEIVGSVMGGYEGHRGWVNYLAVALEHQRKGYGSQLMLEIEKLLIEKGCPKINLQIRTTNQNVISFYKSIGFTCDEVVSMGKRFIEDE
jgi:ribosomal protein S18 acetylase RimI-like enzyme